MSNANHGYRAIVFDIDGTAVPNKRTGMPSARLIQAIESARSHIHLIAATGRLVEYAEPVIKALALTDPCVISGGTIIINPESGQIIRRTTMAPSAVKAMAAIFREYPYEIHLSTHGDGGASELTANTN